MKTSKKRKRPRRASRLLGWEGLAPTLTLGVICLCALALFMVSGLGGNLAENGVRSALGMDSAAGGGLLSVLPDRLYRLAGGADDRLTDAWLAMGGMYDEHVYMSVNGELPDVLYFPDEPGDDHSPEQYDPPPETRPAQTDTPAEQITWTVRDGELPIQNISISPERGDGPNGAVHVSNSTGYEIDIDALLKEPLALMQGAGDIQVLIVHTHTTEAYTDEGIMSYDPDAGERSLDPSLNVTAVGEVFRRELEAAGIGVIHDATVNDHPSYNGSYTRMKAIIEDYLEQYPSIRVVLDIHRDSMITSEGVKYKPVATIDGRQTAQLMLVSGTDLGGLEHPEWEENLKFALHVQKAAEEAYPGLMRPINFREERFNQHLTYGSLILEVGSSGNTLSEALLCAQYGARAIAQVLLGQ